jgi:hypothetical protein
MQHGAVIRETDQGYAILAVHEDDLELGEEFIPLDPLDAEGVDDILSIIAEYGGGG